VWVTPGLYKPGDAELDTLADLLTNGKTSRLYKKLVYDLQLAQGISASQNSLLLGSTFEITVTARPSQDPPDKVLEKLKGLIDEELDAMRKTPPDAREIQRAFNKREASFYSRLERVGGVADQMNGYFSTTGDPDYFAKDLARYKTVTPAAVQAALNQWLQPGHRLELSVVPAGAAK
jgi:zinc protease